MVPYEEVPKYINACDVCVAPFLFRNSGLSPLKVFEYLACGKPVVTSMINGLDFIKKYDLGILVEPENFDELAQALIKLLQNEKLRKKMAKNGRNVIATKYSWEVIAKKVVTRKPGYLYYVDGKGNVCEAKMARGGKKKKKKKAVKKKVKKKAKKKKR